MPVSIATATTLDVLVYLEGLGNAQPLATVSVKSQVDGRLDKVTFREGQEVKKGELLAQIDPRPGSIGSASRPGRTFRQRAPLDGRAP